MASKKKILIVEDEIISVISLRLVLKQLGYDICAEVSSGKDAILTLEQKKPDLVIMDISLSGKMDGIKTAQMMRSKYDTPILFWTGYTDISTLERVANIKNSMYIAKPVVPEDIGPAITKLLTGSITSFS